MLALGIDVGLRFCGYVVCEVNKLEVKLVKEGEVKPSPSLSLQKRIYFIYSQLDKIVDCFKPQIVVLEKLYSHYRHPTTISLLSQVRGAILLLVEKAGLELFEYYPTRARKSFLGRGNADSAQIKKMAEAVLGKELLSKHTADAFSLVVALSHDLKTRRMKRCLRA
ncbi:MAG: crossover junction endodeoxyribonuclease RuvC [Candidatus Omnitrophota bacterium]